MIKALVTGVGSTKVGKVPGSTSMSLIAEASLAAIRDAGLTPQDIDGVLCAYSTSEHHVQLGSSVLDYLGLEPEYASAISLGGASGCALLMEAAALIQAGYCRHILVTGGENRVTGVGRDEVVARLAASTNHEYELPFGMTLPAAYGLVAKRYMHEYGTKPEDFAEIAVNQRRHACLHPLAHFQTPLSLEDVMNSRLIADPLRLFDCCPVSDGGAAYIVSASTAVDSGPRIQLLGAAQGHTHEWILSARRLTEFGCSRSSKKAFERAGVTVNDIDVAEIYDSYTVTVTLELESMGFFEKGEVGDAARRGDLTLGGRLPLNTHGGLLSYGHPGAAGGMYHVIEAVQQLRGTCGARQVKDAEVAIVHGDGGVFSAHATAILGRV